MRLKTLLVCLSAFILSVIMIATGCNRNPVVPAGIFVGTSTPTPTATEIPNPTAAPSSTPVTWVGVTTPTCSDFKNVTVGTYTVETNYWNPVTCGGTQCVNINSSTGAFNVWEGPSANCGPVTVSSYPNIFMGNEEGVFSNTSILPALISGLHSVTSSWNFTPGGNPTDSWDIAYDIWLGPNNNCPGGARWPCGGTELMIWVDYQHLAGYQTAQGPPISVGGTQWQLWKQPAAWTYLSYLSLTPSAAPINNLDIMAFIQDAISKGFVQPSWYILSIPAGIELRTGGIPFTSNSFSVSIQ